METDKQMYELGKQHAVEQMKNEKKLNNVKDIEHILYTKTGVPENKPVKHLKSLDYEKIKMIMYDLGIDLLPEYEILTDEEANQYEESFRNFLIKVYYYINYKNEQIEKTNDELDLEKEKHDSAKENCEDLTKELESLEKLHTEWKAQISCFRRLFYTFAVCTTLFFLQNILIVFDILGFLNGTLMGFVDVVTFRTLDYTNLIIAVVTVYATLGAYLYCEMRRRNFRSNEKEKQV